MDVQTTGCWHDHGTGLMGSGLSPDARAAGGCGNSANARAAFIAGDGVVTGRRVQNGVGYMQVRSASAMR